MIKTAITTLLLLTSLSFSAFAQKIIQVENKKVCMVTNMLFPRDQIPVQVGKKTYYGCCENCKKTLSEDASSRTALDPVSGKRVDKAQAVIGAFADGSVLYFESKKNLETYAKK